MRKISGTRILPSTVLLRLPLLVKAAIDALHLERQERFDVCSIYDAGTSKVGILRITT